MKLIRDQQQQEDISMISHDVITLMVVTTVSIRSHWMLCENGFTAVFIAAEKT